MANLQESTSRLSAPRATTGEAPSHSPPDTRYAPGLSLARGLGWFGIGLGLAEVFASEEMAEWTGIHRPELVRLYGLREIICGLGILNSSQPAAWLWARSAGDALDMATLGVALAENEGEHDRILASMAAVAGVAALDVVACTELTAAAALEG
jgi:hypothetical protein